MSEFEPKQFGKYYLIEKLAVGGMAEIYKAKTYGVDGFEKLLALKRILPHCCADKDFITMLVDEAKLSVTLSHANIVQVYDLGKVGDDYFISMEYINSVNLRDIIYRCKEKNVTIPDEICTYIISEVCKGLDYAHRKSDPSGTPLNIVHRDVSPQNILISYEGEVKIVDFGIAKAAMNISHTMAGILKGKIAYMSPEQALGKTVDYRADIFSNGIVLFETLTLEKLYTGESQFEVLKKIRSTKMDAAKLSEKIPEALKPTLAKALAYLPKDRYQSAGDMQIDLTRYLYTTHVDFTPQKLATFIKELFSDEIDKQLKRGAMEKVFEAQTSSINIAEEALQENLVHREDSGQTAKTDRTSSEQPSLSAIEATDRTENKPKGLFAKLVPFLIAAVIAFTGALSYVKFIQPQFSEKPAGTQQALLETGTLDISSVPDGAKIFIDGKDTGTETPSILENLTLGKDLALKLKKEGFADFEQVVSMTGTEPQTINAELLVAEGILEVVTEPDGAEILLNDSPTGMRTPSTLSGLPINTDLKITLKKEAFKEFVQTVNLTSFKPQKLMARLAGAPEKGIVTITSNPTGAQIYLNGRDTGLVTPANIEDLAIGEKQNIRLERSGFEAETKVAALKDVGPMDLSFELKPLPAKEIPPEPKKVEPVKVEPAKPKVEPAKVEKPVKPVEPKPEKPKPEPKPPAPTYGAEAAPATIKVSSSPSGAEIFINAEHKGTTPATISNVTPGNVSILVNKEGKSRFSKKVQLKPGETLDLGTVKLGELFGAVSISSSPSGGRVHLDGQDLGAKTPVTIKKVARDKSHSLKVVLDGYKTFESTFDMGDGEEKKFNITLEKE